MKYEEYVDKYDKENVAICVEQRLLYGLSVKIDLDDIDCEYECKAYETCPFAWKC